MPIYEYQCGACGHQLEVFQKISEAALTECPVCHEQRLSKLISAAGFQLKGSGWYVTDYSNKGKAKKTEESSSSSSDSGTGKESNTTSKSQDSSNSSSSKSE